MRQIFRVIEFLLEPFQYTLIFVNDIDKLEDSHLPIVASCLRACDSFITTYVPDYKSADYRTPAHLEICDNGIVIPNIYFFGIKPNVGELTYPDGSRGYEDIWLYSLLLHLIRDETIKKINIEEIGRVISELVYFSKDSLSIIPPTFSNACLASSLEQIKKREETIQSVCAQFGKTRFISALTHLTEYLANGIEPVFYTTNHPSLAFIIELSLSILKMLDLKPCSSRLDFLFSRGSELINTTSTDFLYFSAPYQYKRDIGISNPDLRPYITYKPRFSFDSPTEVSVTDYLFQLLSRIQSSSPDTIASNTEKLQRYSGGGRILDLGHLLGL